MLSKSKLKRWSNSYGIVVPKEIVEREGSKEGEEVEISVRKASDLKHLFGKYPFKDLQFQKEEMSERMGLGGVTPLLL
ncbi:MAG: AbrB/MazE/SpoVT family DNA-binding domain-containing protein [Nitrososphaerales archaeon]